MSVMAKRKKNPSSPAPDRHQSQAMVRLPRLVHQQIKAMAARNDRPLSREIVRILIAAMTQDGFWPPPTPSAEEGKGA